MKHVLKPLKLNHLNVAPCCAAIDRLVKLDRHGYNDTPGGASPSSQCPE